MSEWNFKMEEAPKGSYKKVPTKKGDREIFVPDRIIVAGYDGELVTPSYWIPEQSRWCMFTKEKPPIAWAHWPSHPGAGVVS